MVKIKFLNKKTLAVSLKAIGVSIITGIIWSIPILVTRYFFKILELPFVSLLVGVVSLIGYLLTWGFFARKLWGWK